MQKYIVFTGSITYAVKARSILRNHGYKASVERKSSGLNAAGCGYTVETYGDIKKIEELLRVGGVKILEITAHEN